MIGLSDGIVKYISKTNIFDIIPISPTVVQLWKHSINERNIGFEVKVSMDPCHISKESKLSGV